MLSCLYFLRPATPNCQRVDLRPGMLAPSKLNWEMCVFIIPLGCSLVSLYYSIQTEQGRASHGSYSPFAVRVPTCRLKGM